MGYRWYAQRKGSGLGLTGWVRNRPDGTVEAVAEGPSDLLDAFTEDLRQGPAGASVTGVDVFPEVPTGEFEAFSIATTG